MVRAHPGTFAFFVELTVIYPNFANLHDGKHDGKLHIQTKCSGFEYSPYKNSYTVMCMLGSELKLFARVEGVGRQRALGYVYY